MKSSPSEKFSFFMKACGSESIRESLEMVKKDLYDLRQQIEAIENHIVLRKSTLFSLETQMSNYQRVDTILSQIKILNLKRIWAPYHTHRLTVQGTETELANLKEQKNSLQSSLSSQMQEQIPLSNVLASKEDELSSLRQELVAENQTFHDIRKRQSALLTSIKMLQEEKKEVLESYTHISNVVAVSKSQVDSGNEEIHDLRRQLILVENSFQSTKEQLSKLNEEEEIVKNELGKIQELHRDVVETLKCSETSLRKYKEDHAQYTKCVRNRGELYFPSKFNSLVESIRSEKFLHKVKGPVGMFLRMDPRYTQYAKAVESCIGRDNNLKSFLVECIEDQRKMNELLTKYNLQKVVKIFIIEPKTKKLPFSSKQGIVTILDALVVEDIDIFNMLLDVMNIDNIALCPSEEEMMKSNLVRETNGRKHFIENISKIVFQDGSQYVYRDGNSGHSSPNFFFKGLIASSNTSDVADEMKQKIVSEESTLRGIQEEERSLIQKCKELRQSLYQMSETRKTSSQKLKALETKQSSLKEEIQDRENVLLSDSLSRTSDSNHVLLQELLHRQSELDELVKENNCLLDTLKEDLANTQEKKTLLQERVSLLENSVEIEREKQSEMEKTRSLQERKNKMTQESIVCTQEEMESVTRRLDLEKQRLVYLKTTTTQKSLEEEGDGEEIMLSNEETVSYLSTKIGMLEENLKSISAPTPSSTENVRARLQSLQEEIKNMETDLNQLKINETQLETDYENRRLSWKKSSLTNFKLLDHKFQELLKEKENYSGFIENDMEAEKMYFQVNLDAKDNNEKANTIKDSTTSKEGKVNAGEMLSGGQRCSVNTCFLLSLFSVTETPFRVLDEFDVFMDQRMRSKYQEILEEFTLDPFYENRQMIIITPQSLEGVITNDRTQIFRIR